MLKLWERYVLREFRMVPKNPSRGDFHGPYNKLLYSAFPNANYTVFPRFKPGPDPSPYFRLDVLFKHKPVLTLDLNGPEDFQYSSKRQEAIERIQQRIKDLSPECPLPELHAVSAFGTRVNIWKADHDDPSLKPGFLPGLFAGPPPQTFWEYDIHEEEGLKIFKSIVEEIKRDCAALRHLVK